MLAWKIGEDKIKVKVFHEGNFVESIIYSLPTSEHANSDSQESTHVTRSNGASLDGLMQIVGAQKAML